MKDLYCEKYDTSTYGWQIKDYFFLMYNDGLFEIAVKEILREHDYCINDTQCIFSKNDVYENEDFFEGVEFDMGSPRHDSEIQVNEKECLSFVKEAVLSYEKKNPNRKGFADRFFEETKLGCD